MISNINIYKYTGSEVMYRAEVVDVVDGKIYYRLDLRQFTGNDNQAITNLILRCTDQMTKNFTSTLIHTHQITT